MIKELGNKVKEKKLTWREATEIYNEKTNENITPNALRKRYGVIAKNENRPSKENAERKSKTVYGDGTIEAEDIVNLSSEIKDNPNLVLKEMGYNPNEWDLVYMQFSNWGVHTKEQETKQLYAVKFKLRPRAKELSIDEAVEISKQVFGKEIKPLRLNKSKAIKGNEDLMIECPAIELHLGKLAHHLETGENYDYKIARERFEAIIRELVAYKETTNADKLLLSIGNDFFNSDTPTNTTTLGTQMQNDIRWQKMWLVGLEMYLEAIHTLRDNFSEININLVSGNHDTMSSFYLYFALDQAFKNDNVVKFSPEYKKLQVYEFGKCGIFTHHGDFKGQNYKKLIQSVAYEYPEIWGRTEHRELHLGHLHTELVVDEQSGLIVRRIGSPSGTDAWHYENRFIGSRKVHQFFLWNKNYGMINSHYVIFDKKKDYERVRQ